jgi:hypothetical protein
MEILKRFVSGLKGLASQRYGLAGHQMEGERVWKWIPWESIEPWRMLELAKEGCGHFSQPPPIT